MSLFDFIFGTQQKSVGNVRGETQDKIRMDWESIEVLLKQKGPSQLRQALIVADKSLDNALRDLVLGESMGERLKNAKDLFQWDVYQKLWEAHRLRNNLVHESNFEPPYFMITEAVSNIQRGLNALGLKV